jgi:hypothetical protein
VHANNWFALASALCTSHHLVGRSGVHFTNASLLPETQGKAQHNKMSKCTDQNGTFLEQYGVVMRVVKCTMKNVLPMLKK